MTAKYIAARIRYGRVGKTKMTVQRSYGYGGNKNYSNVFKEQCTWLTFTVDSANVNGLGTKLLKSNGYVESVFMHTSQTPGKSPGGFTNPNPPSGYALVTFKSNFNVYLGSLSGQINVLTSTSTTSLTANHVYVITALGNTTLAQWQTAGVPKGFTPAVGTVFVAAGTASVGGTGTVGLPAAPGAPIMTLVGDPNQESNNSNVAANAGAQAMVLFSAPTVTIASYTPAGTITMASYTPAGTITNGTPDTFAGTPAVLTGTFSGTPATLTETAAYTPTALADGTVVNMKFSYDTNGGSNTVDGL